MKDFQKVSSVLANGATLSAEASLPHCQKLFLEVPTMSTATTLYIKAASENGGTFRRVGVLVDGDLVEAQLSDPDTQICEIPAGLRQVKVECQAAPVSGVTYNFICLY